MKDVETKHYFKQKSIKTKVGSTKTRGLYSIRVHSILKYQHLNQNTININITFVFCLQRQVQKSQLVNINSGMYLFVCSLENIQVRKGIKEFTLESTVSSEFGLSLFNYKYDRALNCISFLLSYIRITKKTSIQNIDFK